MLERSPYLQQHATHPIDWYPWGNDAFARAKAENKPIFLSIGYSTCHWCHVMSHESFEDEVVAGFLNKHFVSIKVDREERPDIDHVYMTVCQFMNGKGGWPLTILLTPDKEPFFAGMYFPKTRKHGRPGIMDILTNIFAKWREDQGRVIETASQILTQLKEQAQLPSADELPMDALEFAMDDFRGRYDAEYGGFAKAPKFPSAHQLLFLMREHVRSGQSEPLEMVEKTLHMMYRGGMFDHVGGGFARYSTDEQWLVPHFEKMLYDNALLVMAYSEAFQLTRNALYRDVVERTVFYVDRDLGSAEGLWFAAEDADSEGKEGMFYVWSLEEVINVLGEELGRLVCKQYGVNDAGNFEGKSILNLLNWDETEFAVQHDLDIDAWKRTLAYAREQLLAARVKRVRPHRDEKMLTAWNALWITSLAKAGGAFGRKDWLLRANTAYDKLQKLLRRDDGRWMVRRCEGQTEGLAFLNDYAYLLWATIERYQAVGDVQLLLNAKQLAEDMHRLFWDEVDGAYRFSGADGEALVLQLKEHYDGALPSGNGVAAWQLVRLGRLLNEPKWEDVSARILRCFATTLTKSPSGHVMYLMAMDLMTGFPQQLVVAGWQDDHVFQTWIETLRKQFTPFMGFIIADEKQRKVIDEHVHLAKGKIAMDNRPTAYLCEDGICLSPYTDFKSLLRRLNGNA